jgi:long-chain acyl-CoA synthetase
MAHQTWKNLAEMFFEQADALGERPFLWRKRDGQYTPITWREVAARVSCLARGLRSLGLRRGDRVVIVSENRPAWLIADLAIMAAGGVTVPAYTTNTETDHYHVLENSGARGVIVSTRKLATPLLSAVHRLENTAFVISVELLDGLTQIDAEVLTWKEAIARGEADHTNVVAAAKDIEPTDVACIIYTSGTGGAPKGVMLSHRAVLHNARGAAEVLDQMGLDEAVFLSVLPLSHAYEHTAGQFLPMMVGGQIYYAEGIDKLASNLIDSRPTILSAVPRFYELMAHRIGHAVEKAGGWQEKLFQAALRLGQQRYHNGRLSVVDRVYDLVLDILVRRKVRARFGGRLKAMVSGGAPLNPDVGIFFTALGLPVYQGYGQTEAGPLISVNRPGSREKMHTVGLPIRDVDVKIAADGEILVRGPNVMLGYWRNQQATEQTIKDDWLHTGDIGDIDADGHITISDRKRDIIVNSGGDNISPARIEGLLTLRPEIAQAMVYGDRRPHLVALLVPNQEWSTMWARRTARTNPSLEVLAQEPDFRQAIAAAVDEVNRNLSVVEKVRRFTILTTPFTIENEQLTPTLKIRRHVIRQVYGPIVEGMYRE